jgi:hypothetical protein
MGVSGKRFGGKTLSAMAMALATQDNQNHSTAEDAEEAEKSIAIFPPSPLR